MKILGNIVNKIHLAIKGKCSKFPIIFDFNILLLQY